MEWGAACIHDGLADYQYLAVNGCYGEVHHTLLVVEYAQCGGLLHEPFHVFNGVVGSDAEQNEETASY